MATQQEVNNAAMEKVRQMLGTRSPEQVQSQGMDYLMAHASRMTAIVERNALLIEHMVRVQTQMMLAQLRPQEFLNGVQADPAETNAATPAATEEADAAEPADHDGNE